MGLKHEHDHHHDPSRLWSRQETRLAQAREWWAWAGGREGARVADVGCGPGFLALQYAAWAGPRGHVLALDVDEDALAFLRARAGPHVEARRFDAQKERLADPVDIIFVTHVLHHAGDPAAALRNLRGEGRTLLVADYDPTGAGEFGPPLNERIAPARLSALLREAGWTPEGPPRAQADEQYAIVAR